MLEKLKNHKVISWDFDETLYRHPHSHLFQRFIRDNPYEQEHHIVTFRSHGLVDMIAPDLGEYGIIDVTSFKSICHITDAMYTKYRGGLITDISEFRAWKAQKCVEIGATVLIDDMTADVLDGCIEHGIVHIHPDDLA